MREGKALNLKVEDGDLSLTPCSDNGNRKEGMSLGHLGLLGAGREEGGKGGDSSKEGRKEFEKKTKDLLIILDSFRGLNKRKIFLSFHKVAASSQLPSRVPRY